MNAYRRKSLMAAAVVSLVLTSTGSISQASWLVFSKPAYEGKIIDADTLEPIEGAVVVAIYEKWTLGLAGTGGYSTDLRVVETSTDRNGWFRIPFYITLINPLSKGESTRFVIFKPGHAAIVDWNLEAVFTKKMKGAVEYPWQLKKDVVFRWSSSLVSIPRLETRSSKERCENLHSLDSRLADKLPIYKKLYLEERTFCLEMQQLEGLRERVEQLYRELMSTNDEYNGLYLSYQKTKERSLINRLSYLRSHIMLLEKRYTDFEESLSRKEQRPPRKSPITHVYPQIIPPAMDNTDRPSGTKFGRGGPAFIY